MRQLILSKQLETIFLASPKILFRFGSLNKHATILVLLCCFKRSVAKEFSRCVWQNTSCETEKEIKIWLLLHL